ncbi:MAG TPA: phosphoribosyltransferase [Chthoniobacterales bacterium]|nr:phosphoribosyltransferase [Chthoniobacterales bacterium]
MSIRFRDRTEAGELLAAELRAHANAPDLLVLALPRGGVPVAAVIARELNAPLDVFVVRKLGVPGYPELAMGAIASGGVRALNADVLNSLHVPPQLFEEVTARELQELARRESAYRNGRPVPEFEGKTIILVDDGIATGSTMMAAIGALRQANAHRIVVAAPVIAASTYPEIERAADEVAAVLVSDDFGGVGGFYKDFAQTSDAEVRRLLRNAGRAGPSETDAEKPR